MQSLESKNLCQVPSSIPCLYISASCFSHPLKQVILSISSLLFSPTPRMTPSPCALRDYFREGAAFANSYKQVND